MLSFYFGTPFRGVYACRESFWLQTKNKILITLLWRTAGIYKPISGMLPIAPIVISGHRGGMLDGYPENCIESFEKTLSYMESFFEIDPRLTKDGIIVLMHDETIDRTTTGKGKVSDYTYAELQQFKSGGPKRQRDSLQNSNFKRMPGMEQRQNNPEFGYQGCTFRSYGWFYRNRKAC